MSKGKQMSKPLCLADPLATAGLARLYRERGKAATSRLLDALPELMSLTTDPTVEELLRGGLVQRELLRRAAPLGTIKAHRHAARHVVRCAGEQLASEVDDCLVDQVRTRLASEGMASSTRTRVLSLLRKLHRLWAAANSVPAQVSARPRPRPTIKPAPAVLAAWRLHEVALLLEQTTDLGLRAIVALVVGAGLHPQEVLRLQVNAIDQRGRQVRVQGRKGWRKMPLPPWTTALLVAYLRARTGPRSRWVFPGRSNPARPRQEVNRALQRVQNCSSDLQRLQPVSLQVLRRTWAWWSWYAGLPQVHRTGLWSLGASGEVPPSWKGLIAALGAWQIMTQPSRRHPRQPEPCLRRWNGQWLPGEEVTRRRMVGKVPPPLPRGVWGKAGGAMVGMPPR